MKNYEDFVEKVRETYFGWIKPLIERGSESYDMMGAFLKNIALFVEDDKDIFNSQDPNAVSSGLGLLASMEMMSEKLMKGTFNPERDFKTLESYLDQAKSSNAQATLDNSEK